MRVLCCGDRNWTNYNLVLVTLTTIHGETPIEVVIEGEARGADILSKIAAQQLRIPVLPFRAEWDKYGRAAGPIRNRKQFDEGKPDLVVAFHNDLEHSKGTGDMVRYAISKGCKVRVVTEP